MNHRPAIAILGVGSVRSGPPILASLAHFRTRDGAEIRLYDADDERLDLMDRLARTLFSAARAAHRVTASSSLEDALEAPIDGAVLCAGANCARLEFEPRARPRAIGSSYPRFPEVVPQRRLAPRSRVLGRWLAKVASQVPPATPVLSTMRAKELPVSLQAAVLAWPNRLSATERRNVPHRILRWINGDETVIPLLESEEESPVLAWLGGLGLPEG